MSVAEYSVYGEIVAGSKVLLVVNILQSLEGVVFGTNCQMETSKLLSPRQS